MIIPNWPTQNWFPLMAQCLINFLIQIPSSTTRHRPNISSDIKNDTSRSSFIWTTIQAIDLPEEIGEVICDSWRTKTMQWYKGVLQKWKENRVWWKINLYVADVNSVLKFLHGWYKSGCQYSGICATSVTFLV